MLDPLGPPPAILADTLQPLAEKLGLVSFPLHAHEVVGAFLFYTSLNLIVSPVIAKQFFPSIYNDLSQKNQINWHVRFVSTVQSTLVSVLALYIIFADHERQTLDWDGRLWGYSGASSMVQAFAAGYFIWDLFISIQHLDILGPGSLAHGASALLITSLGFRPFANYYGINLILYELSTPCLNIHWFLDKIDMTGTTLQLVNGILLMATFSGCRLIWGVYQSFNLYMDCWSAWTNATSATADQGLKVKNLSSFSRFEAASDYNVPLWLLLTYLVSNTLLSFLNFYWFGKMVQALKKRFDPPLKTDKKE